MRASRFDPPAGPLRLGHLRLGLESAARIAARDRHHRGILHRRPRCRRAAQAGLLKLGRRIPEDISVMGFDNLSVSRMIYPALTTIDQSIGEKGRLAGNLIAAILDKKDVPRRTVVRTSSSSSATASRRRR
jgi:DNA-binding LacI/PurR family transcriptional regulator